MNYQNKSILITGGTGSLGQAITKYLLSNHPELKRLIVFSRDEGKQAIMSQKFSKEDYPQIHFVIGDVRDKSRLDYALQNVDYVIHTAAMKDVHIAEKNPEECLKTNVGGAQNLIDACLKNKVERVVALSTDKACNPISFYGATKLISDKLFIAANTDALGNSTRFSVVRYGNLWGSNGSVVPFFLRKKDEDGILPITDPKMTRFNITLKKAVEVVIHTLENAWGGEIIVPKLPSYKIMDVANAICQTCEKPIIGIRPGEKLHEEMISSTDSFYTYDLGSYYVIVPPQPVWNMDEFVRSYDAKKVLNTFSYNSEDNDAWESVYNLSQLIEDFKTEIKG